MASDGNPGPIKDRRQCAARLQRQRRARLTRIDYMPGPEALAVIAAKRARQRPESVAATNSAVIDSIVREWARLTGLVLTGTYAHDFDGPLPELPRTSRAGACARIDSDTSRPTKPSFSGQRTQVPMSSTLRVTCGAKRHRDGQPCEAKSEPGKRRCRFHGGRSTGPRTEEGRQRALANLRRGRR